MNQKYLGILVACLVGVIVVPAHYVVSNHYEIDIRAYFLPFFVGYFWGAIAQEKSTWLAYFFTTLICEFFLIAIIPIILFAFPLIYVFILFWVVVGHYIGIFLKNIGGKKWLLVLGGIFFWVFLTVLFTLLESYHGDIQDPIGKLEMDTPPINSMRIEHNY